MTAKYFKYVLFNTKTGAILNTIEPKEDTTLMDINNTGTIELDIPFHSLTNAQRKDVSNVFQPINKGIALLRMNELGETIGCVDAGLIVKREFSVEEQNAHIQTTGFAGYLAKIGAKWVTTPITTKPAPTVTYSGTPAQIYTAILNGALINSDGISTIQNWETGFGSTDARTATFTFPLTDFYTAQDAIEEVRDEVFDGKAAEIRWVPVLQIADNKIKWVARTTTDSNSLINVGMAPLELPLKSWEPSVREIASYEINEDAQDIYNYLVIDASEGSGDNETVFIKAKNETEAGGLTVFQSFDTGVDLTDAQMDAQLNSRLKNANKPEKSGTITLTGSALALENIPYSYEVNGSNYFVNYNTIGRRIKGVAGSKATGLGSTLRCTELSFSIRQWDTSLTLTLQTIMNVYPSLPSQRKLETKKAKKRTSSKKQKKDRDKIKTKTIKGGNDDTLGSDFEWDGTDSGDPIDDVGGSDTENAPELKPDKLPKGEPTDWTLGQHPNQSFSTLSQNYDETFSSSFVLDDKKFIISMSQRFGSYPINMKMAEIKADTEGELLLDKEQVSNSWNLNFPSISEIMNLAPERFPDKFSQKWVVSQAPAVLSSEESEFTVRWQNGDDTISTTGFRKPYLSVFVINNRLYCQFVNHGELIQGSIAGSTAGRTRLIGEVFFCADFSSDYKSLENITLLKSPAEQLWGSQGKNKVILLSQSLSYENSTGLSASYGNTGLGYSKSTFLTFRGDGVAYSRTVLNQTVNYFDVSKNNSKVLFLDSTFCFSRIFYSLGNEDYVFWSLRKTQELGIDYNEMNTEFDTLEADFTNKQPVWKNSKIETMIPKKNKYSRVGTIADENDLIVLGDAWVGDFTKTYDLQLFEYYLNINPDGLFMSTKLQLSQDDFNFVYDGENYDEFKEKYTNTVFTMNNSGEWKSIKIDTKYTIDNQIALWGMALPDGEILTNLKKEGEIIKNFAGDKNSKAMDLIDQQPTYTVTANPMVDDIMCSKKSVIDKMSFSNGSIYSSGSMRLMRGARSKYKLEPIKVTSNNNFGIVKYKNGYLNSSRWITSSVFLLDQVLYLKYGKSPKPSLADRDKVNYNYTGSQIPLNVNLDFDEFASFGGTNIGVDSNGDLWQWGVKLTKQVSVNQSSQNEFLSNDSILSDGVNWEPVKINLPFKVKKIDFTGATGGWGSYNKAVVMITTEGKVFTMGYIDSNHNLSTTWRDATEVVSNAGKITDAKFRFSGITCINENLDLCYSGLSPLGSQSNSIQDIQKVANEAWDGKVKSIKSMPNKMSNNSGLKSIFTTTDGEIWATGTKFTNPDGQKINSSNKVINAYYNNSGSNDFICYIDEKDKFFYLNRSESYNDKFNESSFSELVMPQNFKPEEWICSLNSASSPLNTMIYGKYGSGLTESGAVISVDSFVNASSAWTPDAVGAMRADGFVYGSEVDTGSLFPVLDFLNDGEGSTGQDWSAGSWLTQTGDGEAPTPTEDEVLTGEGEVADKTTVDGVSFPTEWLEEPPIEPPVNP